MVLLDLVRISVMLYFGSAGMGWNIHNEAFMRNNNILNVARLRLSYGSSGSAGIQSVSGVDDV